MLPRVGSDLLRCYETSIQNQRIRDRDTCSIGRHLVDMRMRMVDAATLRLQEVRYISLA
jgi:hypothetical protein